MTDEGWKMTNIDDSRDHIYNIRHMAALDE